MLYWFQNLSTGKSGKNKLQCLQLTTMLASDHLWFWIDGPLDPVMPNTQRKEGIEIPQYGCYPHSTTLRSQPLCGSVFPTSFPQYGTLTTISLEIHS